MCIKWRCVCVCECVCVYVYVRAEAKEVEAGRGGNTFFFWRQCLDGFFFLGSGKLITMSGDFFFKLLSIFFKKHVLFNYEGFFFLEKCRPSRSCRSFFSCKQIFFCFQCFLCNLCGIKYLGKTPPTIVTIHTTLAHTNIRQKKGTRVKQSQTKKYQQ